MKALKYIWKTLLSLFSGVFTKLIGSTKKKHKNKVKISKIKGTDIKRNTSHTSLIIKKAEDSRIEDNKFY